MATPSQPSGNNRYRRKDKRDQVQFTCRLDRDIYEKLNKVCEQKNLSMNFMLNRVVRNGIMRVV